MLEHNIQMGPKLTRMFERLVPMEAFWGTQRYDSMNGSSSSDTAEGNQGKNAQTSFIAQVASELKKLEGLETIGECPKPFFQSQN